jgi:predicted cupin superfamily sugar epimerase
MNSKASAYIKQLQLIKHPEGGYFREVYRSAEIILPEHLPKRYNSSRNFSTSIYFLLEENQFSAFHFLQSDELWHFYDGSSVLLYIIDQKGKISVQKLGREKDSNFQITIKKRNWFAAEVENKKSFSLFGCTVSPGFDFDDFKLGKRIELIRKFPKHKNIIGRLTRI